jgi:hypothetical protein
VSFDLATAKPEGGFDLTTAKPAVEASPILNPVGEGVASLLSGAVATPIAGLAGLAASVLPGEPGAGTKTVARVQNALTYQPRSDAGKAVVGAVSAPFEALASVADKAGDAVAGGGPLVSTAVNTAIQALPMIVGKGANAIKNSPRAVAARTIEADLAAPIQAGRDAARAAGLVITPTEAGAGPIGESLEGLSGTAKLQKLNSKKNAPIINDLIRRDIGLASDVPLSRVENARIRAEAGQDYDVVKNAGVVPTDGQYRLDLGRITASHDMAAQSFSHRSENPFQKVMDGLNTKSFDAASAVEEVKLLRKDADKAYRSGDASLGRSYKEAAQAVDDQLNRHLEKMAVTDPSMAGAVAKYQASRTRIAKTYAADAALNETTGNINPAAYAKALAKNRPLSGEGLTVAQFARQFPGSSQRTERIAGHTGASLADIAAAFFSKEAAVMAARPLGRSLLSSQLYQGLQHRANGIPAPRSALYDVISDYSPLAVPQRRDEQ